jgi:hypothetical protein
MTRALGPDQRDRKILGFTRDYQRVAGLPGRFIDVYLDEQCTVLADICRYDPDEPDVVGEKITNSRIRADMNSVVPRFWYPHGVTRVWGKVNKGPTLMLDAHVGDRPGLLAAEPAFAVGVLQAETKWLAMDYLHGVRIAVIELGWDAWMPTEGNPDEDYIAAQVAKVKAYRNAGYRVGIVSGVHYPPTWLLAKPGAQHVDQWDNLSGGANFQWSATVRAYAEDYLTEVVQTMGDVDFHRVGLSKAGETLYPEAVNNTSLPNGQQQNNWWAFDSAAQASCPMPGWAPGTSTYGGNPVTKAMATAWYDWYFGGLVDAHAWQLSVFRAAGWTGSVQFVTPGVGCLPGELNARLNGLLAPLGGDTYFVMNTGAVWWRFYDEIPDLDGCGLNASSVYDNSGDPRGNVTAPGDDLVPYDDAQIYSWSATRLLSSIARRHGLRPLMGENPGSTSQADAAKVFTTAAGCGLDALLWAFDRHLWEGVHASAADLTAQIFLHSPPA